MKRTLTAFVAGAALAVGGVAVAQEEPGDLNSSYGDDERMIVVGGEDRYETAAEIALHTVPRDPDVLYVANGESLVDALVIGVTNDAPRKMLLVRTDEIPDATRAAMEQIRAVRVVFLGGDGAISPQVRDEVMSLVEDYRYAD